MLTIHTQALEATDGRQLLSLTFERESPDSDSPTIEAIYQVKMTNQTVFGATPVLVCLSTTRTDTREAVALSDEESQQVLQVAANKAAETAG